MYRVRLTRHIVQSCSSFFLIFACYVANGFVAGAKGDDGEEGEDEREGRSYAPGLEDDAEVLGGPGEEHLRVATLLLAVVLSVVIEFCRVGEVRGSRAFSLTFMLHIGMSWPP